jgi:hypothetical protein
MFNKKLKQKIADLHLEINRLKLIIERICPHDQWNFGTDSIYDDYRKCQVCGLKEPLTSDDYLKLSKKQEIRNFKRSKKTCKKQIKILQRKLKNDKEKNTGSK